jgi:Cu+-exporting ATPase
LLFELLFFATHQTSAFDRDAKKLTIMPNNRYIGNLLPVMLVFCLLLIAVCHQARAGMDDMEEHHHHDMQHMHATEGENFVVEIKTEPETIVAGKPATIVFSIKDGEGKPVQDLVVHHDRLVHIVIASQDFRVFAHIHPDDFGPVTEEMKKSALYPVKFTFPKAGRYIAGIDFATKDQLYSGHFLIDVSGEPKMGSLKKDFSRKKVFGGFGVTLSTTPRQITAGKEVVLSYLFRRNGKPVEDLKPYLSAPMHLSIVRTDLAYFIHTHGEVAGMPATSHDDHNMMEMAVPARFGPGINVHVVFPAKGIYQIFGQTGHGDGVILTSFMVKVN